MANKKQTKKYYFTVEGETEHWYLKWLENLINSTESPFIRSHLIVPYKKIH